MKAAIFNQDQGMLLKKQEADRQEYKAAVKSAQDKKFTTDWDEFLTKALASCKQETIEWLNSTEEGKIKLAADVKKHIEECEFTGEGTRGGEEGSGWIRLYSDIYGHMFYYNEMTELKYG